MTYALTGMGEIDVYLLDGTYELFRYFFALPSHFNSEKQEVAAARGTVESVLRMLEGGVTHLGVATDHVIESFRNGMWPGYKTSEGVDRRLLSQFPILEEGLAAMGVALWPMVEREADDALASAARVADASAEVNRVYICTPDKDLAQCVKDTRVVELERRSGKVIDEAGVVEKFGVRPASIPDYLALVGDSADGFPGLPGWGGKSAAALLAKYETLEDIPTGASQWEVTIRGAEKLNATLREGWDLVLLFRDLATLRPDPPVIESVEDLRWTEPTSDFEAFCRRVDSPQLVERAVRLGEMRRTPA